MSLGEVILQCCSICTLLRPLYHRSVLMSREVESESKKGNHLTHLVWGCLAPIGCLKHGACQELYCGS